MPVKDTLTSQNRQLRLKFLRKAIFRHNVSKYNTMQTKDSIMKFAAAGIQGLDTVTGGKGCKPSGGSKKSGKSNKAKSGGGKSGGGNGCYTC